MKLVCVFMALTAFDAAVAMVLPQACPVCDIERCQPTDNCLAGLTRDDCGCCDVCAKEEGHSCDPGQDRDQCGFGLICKDVTATCQCRFREAVCGSDNRVYVNVCRLEATAVREQRELSVQKWGLCEDGATIVAGPKNASGLTGSQVALQCEAVGSPAPSVNWSFTSATDDPNPARILPGDDSGLTTSSRNGPSGFEVTSWLRIADLSTSHEGNYTCVAFNERGSDRASALVEILEGN